MEIVSRPRSSGYLDGGASQKKMSGHCLSPGKRNGIKREYSDLFFGPEW